MRERTVLVVEDDPEVRGFLEAVLALPELADLGPLPPVSGEVVAVLVADLAAELGDAANAAVHQEEAAVLWRRSGLPEAAFAKVLWEVRGRVKRRLATRQGAGPVRVAAFFVLLRDRLGLVAGVEAGAPPARPAGRPPFLRGRVGGPAAGPRRG
jgi:hypothetical protein